MRKWRVCLWRQGERNVETIAADTMAVDKGGVVLLLLRPQGGCAKVRMNGCIWSQRKKR